MVADLQIVVDLGNLVPSYAGSRILIRITVLFESETRTYPRAYPLTLLLNFGAYFLIFLANTNLLTENYWRQFVSRIFVLQKGLYWR